MTSHEALAILRASRDAEHDAPIWDDDGRSITQLAHVAGVKVTYVRVDLTQRELRTVEATERDVF